MLPGRRRAVAVFALALVGGLWASCGESDMGGPGGGGVGNPEFTSCPNISVSDAPATGSAVTYKLVETGGTPPVTTACAPASGSSFPIGTTAVNCSAHDNIGRSAVCSFTVTVASSARLGAMHFLAFGDSTTAGENGIDTVNDPYPDVYVTPTCGMTSLTGTARSLQYFDPSASYPQQLLDLLKAQFPGESFVMENEGFPGEDTTDGFARLGPCFKTGDRPNVLLLLEGVNDIFAATDPVTGENYSPTLSEEKTVWTNLQSDVSLAIANGVPFVFVSTILPIDNCIAPSPCRGADPSDPSMLSRANGVIAQVNTMIEANVTGAIFVDGNAAFLAQDPTLASLIDVDGLHPTKKGYGVLAKAWMSAIVSKVPITSVRRRR